MKITILLTLALIAVFLPMVVRLFSNGFNLENILFLLRIVGYHLVVTVVIYTIAAFIKNDRIRKWFFIVGIVATFLPFIPAIYIWIFWGSLVASTCDSMGAGLMLSLLYLAGAVSNPPMIFAYVAHKIIPPRKPNPHKKVTATEEE